MSIDQVVGDASPGGAFDRIVEFSLQTGARARFVRPRRSRFRGIILLAPCLLAGAILAHSSRQGPVAAVAPGPFSQVGFMANERLAPMASFRPPENVRAPVHYQARVRNDTEERWDTLTFGDAGGDDILFRVTLRSTKSALARASLFVELAKQSAEIGAAVVHATNPQFYATARGPVEMADVTLAGVKGERPCLGFRFDRAQSVDLSGLACGAHGATLDRAALTRLVDRLSATESGVEAGLGEVLKSGPT
jgi:hypothetical protein